MLLWHVLLAIVVAKIAGKKLKEWMYNAKVKKEFEDLVEVIAIAYQDKRVTIPEIVDILKEAVELVQVLLAKKDVKKKVR